MRSQKGCPMADVTAQKTVDALAAFPTAKEVMEQIALKEAEKASAAAKSFRRRERAFSRGGREKGTDRKAFKAVRRVR